MHLFILSIEIMYYLHKTTSAVSCVKPNASQWEATLRDDVGFATVYRRIYRHKFLTLSNQTSRYIRECIRMLNSFICQSVTIWGFNKLFCCPRSDAAEYGIWARSVMFATHPASLRHISSSEMDWEIFFLYFLWYKLLWFQFWTI